MADAGLPPRRPAPDPAGDPRRGGLPRAGHRDHRPAHRLHPGRGRRGPARARRRRGDGRGEGVVPAAGDGARLLPPGGRGGLEGPRGVRLLRVLQGPRRGVRPADLPVGLAQDPLPGALPVRRPHPRPGHVPQAAHPRRRPPVRDRGARARRQRQRAGLHRRAARRTARGASRYGIRLALPRSRASPRPRWPGSSRPGPTSRSPTSGTAPGCPGPIDRAAGAGRRVRQRSTASASRGRCTGGARSPGATCCSRWPTSTATPARSSKAGARPGAGGCPVRPAGPRAAPRCGSTPRPAATAATRNGRPARRRQPGPGRGSGRRRPPSPGRLAPRRRCPRSS